MFSGSKYPKKNIYLFNIQKKPKKYFILILKTEALLGILKDVAVLGWILDPSWNSPESSTIKSPSTRIETVLSLNQPASYVGSTLTVVTDLFEKPI